MSREYQLGFCKVCKNKAFDRQQGIVCSLTNKHADFIKTCDNFDRIDDEDVKAIESRPQVLKSGGSDDSMFGSFNGYLVSLYGSLFFIILGIVLEVSRIGGGIAMSVLAVLASLIATILVCVTLFRVWKFVIKESKLNDLYIPVKSAGQAIGFMFIPIFNFYWIFIAIGQLPASLNRLAEARNSKARVPEGIGVFICTLAILGIIPRIGAVFSLVSGFILVPILLKRAIKLVESLPAFIAITDEKEVEIREPISLLGIRSFTDIFQKFDLGFNYKLALLLTLGAILTRFIISFVSSGFSFHSFSFSISLVYDIISKIAVAFLFVLFCHKMKSIPLLAIAIGGLYTIFDIASNYITYYEYKEYIQEIESFINITTFVTPFINGVVIILLFSLIIKNMGVSFGSIAIVILASNIISNAIWYSLYYTIVSDSEMTFNKYTVLYPLVHIVVTVVVYYFGISWYLNPLAEGTSKITRSVENTLDANIG